MDDEGGLADGPSDTIAIEIDGRPATIRSGSVAIAAITSLHEHLEPDGHGRRRAPRPERGRPRPDGRADGQDLARARLEGRHRLPRGGRADGPARRPSASPWPATAARPASATPARSTSRSPRPIEDHDLVVAAVLSGNRNFEGRIHPLARASYLASPPLVVAFALAGRVDIDLTTRAARDRRRRSTGLPGRPLAGRARRSGRSSASSISPDLFRATYASVFEGDERWRALPIPAGDRFAWDPASTYVARPPFLEGLASGAAEIGDIAGARVLALLGDSVTTDHISPAGSIAAWSPGRPVAPGARRRPARVQLLRRPARPARGDDPRARSPTSGCGTALVEGREGPYTVHLPDGEEGFIYDAAERYRAEGVPLLVIAGREYGSGSSRDWAAKGTPLLGVRAVIAESYERIHRSNLVGHGRAAAPVPARRERRRRWADRARDLSPSTDWPAPRAPLAG